VSMAVRGELGYYGVFPKDYDFRNTDNYDMMSDLSVGRVCEAATELWQRVKPENDVV
jgi:hypothetical protein